MNEFDQGIMRDVARQVFHEEVAKARAARQAGGAAPVAPPAASDPPPYQPAPPPSDGLPASAVTVCLSCGQSKARSEFSDPITWARGLCRACQDRGSAPYINDAAPGAGEPQTPEWESARILIPQLTRAVFALRQRLERAIAAFDHAEILFIRELVRSLEQDKEEAK